MTKQGGRSHEAGFTLIELLVVLVIIPLIIGAAADAIIVTVGTDAATSGRIADSSNAQLSAAYFARDIQGALELTTDQGLAPGLVGSQPAPFVSTAPEVCAPAPVLSASSVPPGLSLVVALYRPASPISPATDIGYWLQGTGSATQLVRYSCSLTPGFAASDPVSVTLADNASNPNSPGAAISSAALSVSDSILPAQIGAAAALGWTGTQASTVYQGPTISLGGASYSLTAAPSQAFAPGWITAQTSVGRVPVDCSGSPVVTSTSTTFEGCSGGSGVVSLGDTITQSAVTGVEATVTEPTSSYHFVLLGSPYAGSSGAGQQGSGATLLILGSGGINLIGTGSYTCPLDSQKDKLCVTGSVVLDGGTASCNGNAAIGTTGSIGSVTSPLDSTCDPGQIASSPVVADPVAQHLTAPCLTSTQSAPISALPTNPTPDASGNLVPGIYTQPVANATLEPGVYVLEGGANGGVTIAAPSAADPWYQNPPGSGAANYDPSAGLLLYLPGVTGTDPAGCLSAPSPPAASLKDPPSTGISVAPLDSAQASYWLNNPYLADTWIWQDVTNTQPLSLSGNVTVTSKGLAYLPGATLVTSSGAPSITTGRMIVGGVQLDGTPSITLNGS